MGDEQEGSAGGQVLQDIFHDCWIILRSSNQTDGDSCHLKVSTDSSDSEDEANQSLDNRPEYKQAEEKERLEAGQQPNVRGALEERLNLESGNLNLEEQLNRVKLAESTLSSSILKEGVGASFGETGGGYPHIDIGSLGSNSTIVIGTHITVVSENSRPINTSPSTTPGGSNPALDNTSSASVTTCNSYGSGQQRPSVSSNLERQNLERQTEDIRFYFTSQLGHGTLPWIVQPAPQFENFTVVIFLPKNNLTFDLF